jgi:toxin YoeB
MKSLVFEGESWAAYEALREADKKAHKKLCTILNEMLSSDDPCQGVGKPEPLRYNLSSYWSRRITQYHRIIYYFDAYTITVVAVGGHYDE